MKEDVYEPLVVKESCPYCGEMTDMRLEAGVWISHICLKCGKNIDAKTLGVPELVDEQPDHKAKPEVLP